MVAAAVLAAPVDAVQPPGGAAPAATATLTVTPADGLTDGETVNATGAGLTGWPVLVQCVADARGIAELRPSGPCPRPRQAPSRAAPARPRQSHVGALAPPSAGQEDDLLQVAATGRGIAVKDGGYLWRGEQRRWDNELLMGWYAATDGAVRSKGTMHFTIHAHGVHLPGRWVGMSYHGKIVTGWSAMAHDGDDAVRLIGQLKDTQGKVPA